MPLSGPADASAREHLPLKADVLMILLALRDGERHGYAIMRDASERSEGVVRLQTGALYRTLRHLLDDGLVEESGDRPASERDDERRRYYRLTSLGAAVLAGELERLAGIVARAGAPRPSAAARRPRLA